MQSEVREKAVEQREAFYVGKIPGTTTASFKSVLSLYCKVILQDELV